MNLIYGAEHPDTLKQLDFVVDKRYSGQKIRGLAKRFRCIRSSEKGLVGVASDSAVGAHLLLLGLLNRDGESLSESCDQDAQCALEIFRNRGFQGLINLDGQYVIALYEELKDILTIIPDPNGLRSVFYNSGQGNFAFASNLSSLVLGMNPTPGINTRYHDFFLSFGFFPFNQTIYNQILRIPGTHVLQRESSKTNLIPKSKWSQLEAKPRLEYSKCTEDQLIGLIDETFTKVTREQLSPDSKVGVLLGGFDSALVAAYLAREGKEVHTYSFGYDDRNYNQTYVDEVVDHLGCIHHWVPMNSEIIKRGLDEFDLYFNAPTNWLNYPIQTESVCRVIREEGIRHVYSGDGCDSVFLGYPNVHKTSVVFDWLGKWPSPLVQGLIGSLNAAWMDRAMGRPYAVIMHLLRSMMREMPERGLLTFQIMDPSTVARLQGKDMRIESLEETLREVAKPHAEKSLDRIAYAGKSLLSPNLSKMIGSSDSTGVVIQAPYLHPQLKTMAANLPDEFCRPKGVKETKVTGKYILMRMAESKNLLPNKVIYQKKISAVDAPLDEWLKEDLRNLCQSILGELPFRISSAYQDSLLSKKPIEEFHRNVISSDRLTTHALSLLLTSARFTRHLSATD